MPSPSAVSVFKTSLLTHSLISTLDFYPDSNQTGSRVPINTQSRQSLSSGSSFDLTEVDSQHGESLSSVEEDRVSLPSVISARSNNASPHLPELDEEILNLLEQSRIKGKVPLWNTCIKTVIRYTGFLDPRLYIYNSPGAIERAPGFCLPFIDMNSRHYDREYLQKYQSTRRGSYRRLPRHSFTTMEPRMQRRLRGFSQTRSCLLGSQERGKPHIRRFSP